jgi:Glycosyl transferase family 90
MLPKGSTRVGGKSSIDRGGSLSVHQRPFVAHGKRMTTTYTKYVLILVVIILVTSFRPLVSEQRLRARSHATPSTTPQSPGTKHTGTMTKVDSVSYRPHCPKFDKPPVDLSWEDVYSLEWNGTPAILKQIEGESASFQTTQFTSHVQQLVGLIDLKEMETYCTWKFELTVDKPYTVPVDLSCQGKARQRMVPWWCTVFERIFLHHNETKAEPHRRSANLLLASGDVLIPVLPGSVTLAVSSDDYYKKPQTKRVKQQQSSKEVAPYTCLANSSPNGTFAITNFLELQRMTDATSYPILPWHERCSLPVWRGSAWMLSKSGIEYDTGYRDTYPVLTEALRDCLRCRAVEFSNRHDDLLDAKFGDSKNGFFHPSVKPFADWWKQNSTNALERLLPIHYIPPAEYYSHFQVALVLCGLGAAFRTPIHLSTATAVVLQGCDNHEWYYPWFQPWVHYIPLQNDLSDLKETLTWIRSHPGEVHMIAQQGRQFYEKYLSFQRNYEHFYELSFRMALKKLGQDDTSPTVLRR